MLVFELLYVSFLSNIVYVAADVAADVDVDVRVVVEDDFVVVKDVEVVVEVDVEDEE